MRRVVRANAAERVDAAAHQRVDVRREQRQPVQDGDEEGIVVAEAQLRSPPTESQQGVDGTVDGVHFAPIDGARAADGNVGIPLSARIAFVAAQIERRLHHVASIDIEVEDEVLGLHNVMRRVLGAPRVFAGSKGEPVRRQHHHPLQRAGVRRQVAELDEAGDELDADGLLRPALHREDLGVAGHHLGDELIALPRPTYAVHQEPVAQRRQRFVGHSDGLLQLVAQEADVVVDGGGAVVERRQVPVIAKQEPVAKGAAVVVLGRVNHRRVD